MYLESASAEYCQFESEKNNNNQVIFDVNRC